MRGLGSGGAWAVGLLMVLGLVAPSKANATRSRIAAWHSPGASGHHAAPVAHARTLGAARHIAYRQPLGARRHAWRGYARLQCVPFARSDSGIELKGNANIWWNEAAGRYERGSRPEPGSVLSFSANGRMRLGHVAVVSHVVGAREIEIDHANWWGPGSRGGVTRGVPVIDVSPDNDWTEVRVSLGGGEFGSVYRTHGFIYDRPDSGTMLANATPARAGGVQTVSSPIAPNEEVAELPDEAEFRTSRWAGPHVRHHGQVRPFGHPQFGHGHAQSWHPQSWHPQSWHPQSARPQSGRPQSARPQSARPQSGHPLSGRSRPLAASGAHHQHRQG
jgi:surface antigen